jgi:hypothetical protein
MRLFNGSNTAAGICRFILSNAECRMGKLCSSFDLKCDEQQQWHYSSISLVINIFQPHLIRRISRISQNFSSDLGKNYTPQFYKSTKYELCSNARSLLGQ